jgi:hypothetical protein
MTDTRGDEPFCERGGMQIGFFIVPPVLSIGTKDTGFNFRNEKCDGWTFINGQSHFCNIVPARRSGNHQ